MKKSWDQFLVIDTYTYNDSASSNNDIVVSCVRIFNQSQIEYIQITANSSDEDVVAFIPMLHNHLIIMYEASSQSNLLNELLHRFGYGGVQGVIIDLQEMVSIFYPTIPNSELDTIASYLQISTIERASNSKVNTVADIFMILHQHVSNLPLLLIQNIKELTRKPTDSSIWLYLSDIELDKLSTLDSAQLPPDVIVKRRLILKKIHIDTNDYSHENPAELLNFFNQGDSQQDIFKNFEARPQQQQMLIHVQQALEDGKHLLVEAGTGTGKTLAYLLPLLHYSISHSKTVVVSTHTLLLQRQILDRDIPILKKIYPTPFIVAILKGRSHYLCLRKLNHMFSISTDSSQSKILLAKVLVWLANTESGEGDEIHLSNPRFWQQVNSEAETCLNKKCLWFHHCFYHLAKEKAYYSNIIITNHSLVFTDLKSDHQILPNYSQIVFDEAHHLENEATNHLGIQIQYFEIKNMLIYLYKDHKSGIIPKTLSYIQLLLNQGLDDNNVFVSDLNELATCIVEYKIAFEECIYTIISWLQAYSKQSEGNESIRYNISMRTDFPYYYLIENIINHTKLILKQYNQLEKQLQQQQTIDDTLNEYCKEIISKKKLFLQIEQNLLMFFDDENEDYVYWIEANFATHQATFYCAPINVGTLLQEKLFEKKTSCILTSATLAIRDSFKYVIKRLGLSDAYNDGRVLTLSLDSPFNYEQQCLVCIPKDIPSVKNDFDFIKIISKNVADIAIINKGKTLLLFTSYKQLSLMHTMLSETLQNTLIKVIGQNIDGSNRSKLLEDFLASEQAILLGTNSFWEGIDIPGNALTCVCIIKLPFWPPNLPIVEARTEKIDNSNKNSFMEYSVPEAIIRFKQGFGRLIRTKSDRGVIVIFDKRIIDSFYGKFFLHALPKTTVRLVTQSEMLQEIDEWNK